MANFDLNRLWTMAALIVIIAIAAFSNYRLEIGAAGLKFEPIGSRAEQPMLPDRE
ncbi:hypothetical protein ACQKGL_18040 [Ensifer adhaerens]|uniref:hypothetical protein n=1 Tax=Ensifer adhaerens TaxID=106592 RepID=UPI003D0346DA